MENTVTIRIQGTNLLVYIPEWDQLTVEHVYVPPTSEVIMACADGRHPEGFDT